MRLGTSADLGYGPAGRRKRVVRLRDWCIRCGLAESAMPSMRRFVPGPLGANYKEGLHV